MQIDHFSFIVNSNKKSNRREKMGEALSIAHILCSRLCHDVITPLSAISTGLELLEENSTPETSEIISLLKKSTTAANQRLSLFRLVFGDSALTSIASIEQLIDRLRGSLDLAKFELTVEKPQASIMEGPEHTHLMRTIACLTFCATEIAPYGGRITWSSRQGEEESLKLALEGATLVLSSEIVEGLTKSSSFAAFTPRTICAYLAAYYANRINYNIRLSQSAPHLVTLSLVSNKAREIP
jgi:histidine phosphotransferase ChpT